MVLKTHLFAERHKSNSPSPLSSQTRSESPAGASHLNSILSSEELLATSRAEEVHSIRFKLDVGSSQRLQDDPFLDDSFSVVSSEEFVRGEPNSSPASEKEVSINLSAKNFTKLEVIAAKDVTNLLMWLHAVIIFGIAFSVVFVILANTVYLKVHILGETTARYYNLPIFFDWIFSIAGIVCFTYALSLATVYTSRMVRIRRKDRTHEQVWVILLTVASAMYLNPYENIARIMSGAGYDLRQDRWYNSVSRLYDSIRDASFTTSTLFYVWATVHSYRVLNGKLGIKFYLPKVLLVFTYVLLKQIAFWRFSIYMSEMPIASFIAMLHVYRTLNIWPLSGVLCVVGVTIFEIALVVWILYEIQVTRQFLKGKDYMKYRVKQIGIRFFLYHNLTFYLVYWICYLLLLLGLPSGAQLAAMHIFGVSYMEVQYVPFGLTILYLSYVTVEAYMNLPADAIGAQGWLHPQTPKNEQMVQPITYRNREVRSQTVQANCFVMETQARMLNFAWLVYYYDTKKMEKLRNMDGWEDCEVDEVVCNRGTDTIVLLINTSDKIIVSFRGTSSARNLRTDLKAFHMKISRFLPTDLGDHKDSEHKLGSVAHAVLSSREAQFAKIHQGFAEAYVSVGRKVMSGIRRMYERDPRPIFLTGHSLGGALAVICAYDCVLRLEIGSRDLYVATFGSPRVGNSAFRKLFEEAVPACWRVALAADIVTKLPRMDYVHVGKKVMLTTAGNLFIDPNSLELSHWNGDASSFVHHRKSSYLLAMRSWCNRHQRGTYDPPFWDWPISSDDLRRWPGAISRGHKRKAEEQHRRNLLHQDAMIDALNSSHLTNPSERAIENWSRLCRRLLLNNSVHRV